MNSSGHETAYRLTRATSARPRRLGESAWPRADSQRVTDGGSAPLHWTHQRASLDSCGALEVTIANPSRGSPR